MRTDWSHLTYVTRQKVGRDWHNTYKGFSSEEEAKDYGRHYEESWYVYFPKVLRIWKEDDQWFLTMRVADSCD